MADRLSPAVLAEILDGGQAFRWHRRPDGSWVGAWGPWIAGLRLTAEGEMEWSAPGDRAAATEGALRRYLDADRPAQVSADALPWRSDAHLQRAIEQFPGLRVLRQPFAETLLGFLCSAAKRIVQIRQMNAALAAGHGAPFAAGPPIENLPAADLSRRLPTWEALALASEASLLSCKLGFRARHIRRTAEFLADRPGWLEETEALPYADAKVRLLELPGVGEKVADCVLLFGANRLEAFPVDVWILGAMARRYGLAGWTAPQVAQFGRVHFGAQAGLAQQYLFAWERHAALSA